MKYYVYDPHNGSSGDWYCAFSIVEAETRGQARVAFMQEWEYPEEFWFTTPLRIRKWRPCDTCGGQGIIPYPETHELYDSSFPGVGEFCPDCLKAKEKQEQES